MNELQTAIYNTTKTINSIDTAINKFDKLDKQVIKTKDDIDEMNEALSSVRDTIAKED